MNVSVCMAYRGGADGYIQKPFHVNFVKLRMIRILDEQKKKLREALLKKLQSNNMLMAQPEKVENMDDLFLRRFLTQIEEIYTDSEFNVEKLSDTLGLSRGHLHRKIKDLTGTSPVDFLRQLPFKEGCRSSETKSNTISTRLLTRQVFRLPPILPNALRPFITKPRKSIRIQRGYDLNLISYHICRIYLTDIILLE